MPCLRRITRSRLRRRPERSSRRLAPASRGDVQRPCSPRATATCPLARAARRHPFLDPGRGAPRGTARAAVDRLTELDPARLRRLQRVGTLSGFAAGAWLGAAEAPTKLVALGIPPVVISFMMVLGVFLARWSLPALVRGTAAVRDDVRQAPHLIVWAALAGCLWAVANTLTIFAIKDIGLAIAFPLWNANSLLGILWGTLLFNELRDAGSARWLGVLGGAVLMFTAPRCSRSRRRPTRPGATPCAASPPHSPPAPSGARCTSPTVRHTSPGCIRSRSSRSSRSGSSA